MVHLAPSHLWSALGIVIWGDLAAWTLYRDKQGKLVAFPKTYPHKAPSADQLAQRAKLTAAAAAWRALTPTQRAQWELATRRASLCCHGYNLWVHWQLSADEPAIRTLERQSRTSLLPP